ncbi:unnamed protein product [Leptidea sinapis]|uniref:Uncharacterized protein n=1 Tax=Leptidea sinapis TaxID=189913 RepID=A0A5E4PQ71_9NEOP|nr:unnamed protein product [Leptidea sinapis]
MLTIEYSFLRADLRKVPLELLLSRLAGIYLLCTGFIKQRQCGSRSEAQLFMAAMYAHVDCESNERESYRIIRLNYETETPFIDQDPVALSDTANIDSGSREKLSEFKHADEQDNSFEAELEEKDKQPCTLIILSNIHNPSMQSLLRKYRYNANDITKKCHQFLMHGEKQVIKGI